jgi:hypothetical protein
MALDLVPDDAIPRASLIHRRREPVREFSAAAR